jgi:hypothetical protein
MTPKDKHAMMLAAIVAGYSIWWKTGTCKGGPYESAFFTETDQPWRPLDDDGDALRLLIDVAQRAPTDAYFGRTLFCLDEGSTDVISRTVRPGINTAQQGRLTSDTVRRTILEFAATRSLR